MTTAIGSYATLAAVKARLSGTFDNNDDDLIGTLCDQANQYIESPQGTGRVLAPRPVGSGVASDNEVQSVTITGSPAGGTWTLTFDGSTTTDIAYDAPAADVQTTLRALPTINGANVDVTGSAGGPYTVEFVGALAGLAQPLMTATDALTGGTSPGVTVALVSTPQDALYYFDGDGGRVLYLDVRAVTALAIASQTGGSYTTLPVTDYFLRPLPQERSPGWPATRIVLSDQPTGGFHAFPVGFATVRLTAVLGWPAIPDDITDLACTMVVRAWHARQSGQTDIVGNDETGAPIVSRYLSARDRDTLKAYRVAPPVG
jgi:hypothetical protein